MNQTKANVLIIEDDPHTSELLSYQVTEAGYKVSGIFANGEDALQFLEVADVDVIILDISLTGSIDGIETALQINKLKELPVIYLTLSSQRSVIERAGQTNPAAYIIKPWNGAALILTIEIALNHYSYASVDHARETQVIEVPEKEQCMPLIKLVGDGLYIKQHYRYLKVNVEDITHVQADNQLTSIFTHKRKFVLRKTLTDVLRELSLVSLVRIHRSHAVNLLYMTSFSNRYVTIGTEEFLMTHQYKSAFLDNVDKVRKSTA